MKTLQTMERVFILNQVVVDSLSVNITIGVYTEFHIAMKALGATKATRVSEAQWMVAVADDMYTITQMEVQSHVTSF